MVEIARSLRTNLRALIRNLGVLRARYPELGVGVTQCHTLLELEQRPHSLGQLSAILQIDASSASRNLAVLERHGWVSGRRDPEDARRKLFRLTPGGRSKARAVQQHGDRVMADALSYLTPDERTAVQTGLGALATAVGRANGRAIDIRRSRHSDNRAIAHVIRSALSDMGLDGPGTAFHEPETDEIHDAYRRRGGTYLVVVADSMLSGGGGIVPHGNTTCELKNLYFLASLRGRGQGKRLLNRLLELARQSNFREVFLETRTDWATANHLYERFGFRPCPPPKGYRGHSVCDRYLAVPLS